MLLGFEIQPWWTLLTARAWLDMSLGFFEIFLNPCSWSMKFNLGHGVLQRKYGARGTMNTFRTLQMQQYHYVLYRI
jgi:hypothetical protein